MTTARGFVMMPELRNNDRVIFDDMALAQTLFERVRHSLPRDIDGRVPVGGNERLRCYRYAKGQRFKPHFDGAFRRNDTEQSELTLIVYLNDGFVGGETAFLDLEQVVTPLSRHGAAVHPLHPPRGCEVLSGTKYVLRSDVMYAART